MCLVCALIAVLSSGPSVFILYYDIDLSLGGGGGCVSDFKITCSVPVKNIYRLIKKSGDKPLGSPFNSFYSCFGRKLCELVP